MDVEAGCVVAAANLDDKNPKEPPRYSVGKQISLLYETPNNCVAFHPVSFCTAVAQVYSGPIPPPTQCPIHINVHTQKTPNHRRYTPEAEHVVASLRGESGRNKLSQ